MDVEVWATGLLKAVQNDNAAGPMIIMGDFNWGFQEVFEYCNECFPHVLPLHHGDTCFVQDSARPIDFTIVSKSMLTGITRHGNIPTSMSTHKAIYVNIRGSQVEGGSVNASVCVFACC